MPREIEDLGSQVEELLPGFRDVGGLVTGRLGDRLRALRVPGGCRLRQVVDRLLFEAERFSHLADRGTLAVGHDITDHPGPLRSVFFVDVLDDLLPMGGREVDIDVGRRRHLLMEEALEEQVVLDRIDPRDAEQVGDDAVRRRATPLARDAARPGKPHQVPVDEEELGKAGLVDDVELFLQAGRDLGGDRMIFLPHGVLAQPVQKGVRRLPRRDREPGKARAHQVEAEAATPRNFRGMRQALVGNLLRVAAEDLAELGAGLEVVFGIWMQVTLCLVERGAMTDRGEDVVEPVPVGCRIKDLVGDDQRRAVALGQVEQPLVARAIIRRQVIVQFDEDAIVAEDLLVEGQPLFGIGHQRDQVPAQ